MLILPFVDLWDLLTHHGADLTHGIWFQADQ
jgi:hypothetical protein